MKLDETGPKRSHTGAKQDQPRGNLDQTGDKLEEIRAQPN